MIILLIPSVLNHYKAPKEGPERAALAKAVLEGAIGREARCALITESDVLWPTRVKFQFFLPSFRPPSPAPGVEQAPGRGENRAPFSAPKNSGEGDGGFLSRFLFSFSFIVKFGGSSHRFLRPQTRLGFSHGSAISASSRWIFITEFP